MISAFAFIGGSFCCAIVVFFPMWIKVNMSEKRWYQGENLLITIVNVFVTTLGLASSILSLLDTIGVIKIDPDKE